MLSYTNQIIRIDTNSVPAVPSGDNFSSNGFTVATNKLTLDGTLYDVSNYLNGQNLSINFRKVNNSDGVRCSITVTKYDSSTKNVTIETILSNEVITNKSLLIEYGRAGESNLADGVPNNWASFITVIGTQFNITVSGSNFTVVNNPSVSNAVGSGNYRYTIEANNELVIRSNSGYKLSLNDITISCNGTVIPSEYGRLSDDETEFYFNTIIEDVYFPPFTSPNTYSLFLLPPMTVTVVPVQIPNKTITNTLLHVNNSNPATTIIFNSRYQATLTAQTGYYISNVIITMDGVDITSDVYNNGVIDIPSVTGDVVINAVGTLNPTITNTLTNCTTNNPATTIQYGTRYQATITANQNYSLDGARVLITMNDVELFDVYNNGVIDIPSVTGDVVIIVIANSIKTFLFKSMDGNTTYATYRDVKLRSILFEINGNTRTLTVNGTSYSWVSVIPQGKQLYGLALTSDSDRWLIPVNTTVIINYAEDTTFYEVILDESEQAQTFSLMLYKNSAEAHRVDKTEFLEYVNNLDGTLRKACSIIAPEIDLAYSIVDFNYIYIPIYNRYYFVTDVVYLNKGLIHISLKVDTLMSFKNIIYSQKGLIGRNEFNYNDNLIDKERIINNNPIVETITGTGTKFNPDTDGNIVLNVVGGS